MIFYHWNCRSIFNPCGDSVQKLLVIDSWCNRTCCKGLINFQIFAAAKGRKSKKNEFVAWCINFSLPIWKYKTDQITELFHFQIKWLWGPESIERNFYYCVTIVNANKKNSSGSNFLFSRRMHRFCDMCNIYPINYALLVRELQLLSQKSTFLPRVFQKMRKSRQILISRQNSVC